MHIYVYVYVCVCFFYSFSFGFPNLYVGNVHKRIWLPEIPLHHDHGKQLQPLIKVKPVCLAAEDAGSNILTQSEMTYP